MVKTNLNTFFHISDLSEKCEDYAIKSLCYAALPLCNENAPEQEPRKLCREECEILVSVLFYVEREKYIQKV